MTQPLHHRQLPEHPIVNRRLDNLERRSLTQQSNLSRPSAVGGAHFATRLVAASDATDFEKENADYVCDGIADNIEIQAALDDCWNVASGAGGDVRLTGGFFSLLAVLTTRAEWVAMHGAGQRASFLRWSGGSRGGAALVDSRGGAFRDIGFDDHGGGSTSPALSVSGGIAHGLRFDCDGPAAYIGGASSTVRDLNLYSVGQGVIVANHEILVDGVEFSGFNVAGPAVHVLSGTRNRIVGCGFTVSNGGAVVADSGVTRLLVAACRFRTGGSGSADKTVAVDGDGCTIQACDFAYEGSGAPTCVDITGTADKTSVAFNTFRGWAGSEIADAGSGSVTTPNVVI